MGGGEAMSAAPFAPSDDRPRTSGRTRSLSAILGDVVVRHADWARVRLLPGGGLQLPAGDPITVHFVTRGEVQLRIGHDVSIDLLTGDALLLLGETTHTLRTRPGAEPERLRYFDETHGLDIPPMFELGLGGGAGEGATVLVGRLHFHWPPELPERRLLPPILQGTRSYRADTVAAHSAAAALEATASGPGAALCLTRFAELLLARELRNIVNRNSALLGASPHPAASAIDRAVESIRLDPGKGWSVDGLARSVGMSRAGFAAHFKEETGQSPMEMVTILRMEMAAALLREASMPVKAVAARVGYRSDTAFVRSFTGHYGTSPGAYRRALPEAPTSPVAMDWFDLFC
jgi:AraC-like DNA-binding protein